MPLSVPALPQRLTGMEVAVDQHRRPAAPGKVPIDGVDRARDERAGAQSRPFPGLDLRRAHERPRRALGRCRVQRRHRQRELPKPVVEVSRADVGPPGQVRHRDGGPAEPPTIEIPCDLSRRGHGYALCELETLPLELRGVVVGPEALHDHAGRTAHRSRSTAKTSLMSPPRSLRTPRTRAPGATSAAMRSHAEPSIKIGRELEQLVHRVPVADRGRDLELAVDVGRQLGAPHPVGKVEVDLPAANRELVGEEALGVELLHHCGRRLLLHEADMQLRRVGIGERVALHDLAELRRRSQHHARSDPELLRDRALQILRRDRLGRREDDVAALDERAHVRVIE